MRSRSILLDTNIVIYREGRAVTRDNIGELFRWVDRLGFKKYVHASFEAEIRKHKDPEIVRAILAKANSYEVMVTKAPDTPAIAALRIKTDRTDNDRIDTDLLAEVASNRVDYLLTEDRGVHRKAATLGLASRVLHIDRFIEIAMAEQPALADYKILAVHKQYFGKVDLSDGFFDSFRETYPGFNDWFNRKANEVAYVYRGDDGRLLGFLYLKPEGVNEPYSDIQPQFQPKKRLKIGTFKVLATGERLGERFLKIAIDNARNNGAAEIYVTIVNRDIEQQRLINLLEEWGFRKFGIKVSSCGSEDVFVRSTTPQADRSHPETTYPYMSAAANKYIVSIYPKYHTNLFPDSILRTESPDDFAASQPHRNAIKKVYVSRSGERGLAPGDIIVFYRTQDRLFSAAPAHYTAAATTMGVVTQVHNPVASVSDLQAICRGRSVYSPEELVEYWAKSNPTSRPFAVEFLYVHSFPKRLILATLKQLGIISEAPRRFVRLTDQAFRILLEKSNADSSLVVY